MTTSYLERRTAVTMKRLTPLSVMLASVLAMQSAVANGQVAALDAESEAEAALKALGANISRNDDGEVWSVVLDYGRQVSEFGDNDVVHLTKLNWAEGVPGDHDFSEILGIVPSHPAPFLILVDTKLTDAGIEQMKALTQIRYFNLNGNKGITDAGLASFVKSHKIVEELLLMGTSISDDGIEHLKALPKLHGLRVGTIGTTKVTNAGLENLKGLNNLTRLGFTGSGVTDAGLMQLKERIGLKELLLKGTKISNAGLVNLKGMVGLRSLDIGDTEITDAGLVHLKDLTKLEKLVLRGSKVADEGLVYLKGLSNLRWLLLDRTDISDDGLIHLVNLKGLKYLTLAGTNISDKGVAHLKELTNLESLNLLFTDVTDHGVSKLKEALPNCNIATGIPSATMIFGRYDNNNDGKLTRGEFEEISEYFRGRLVLADENSDGAITKEELEAHLEQLQR